jgi:hypothetical protein
MQSTRDQIILEDASNLVEEGRSRGLYLRILGAVGVRINASKHEDLFARLNRLNSEHKFTDIDFAAYGSQRSQIRKLLQDLGYNANQQALMMHGNSRMIFDHPEKQYHIDIFFDRLRYSHDVNFGKNPRDGRLDLHSLTISATDLALEKLQIHEINEKDVKDLVLLFAANAISQKDGDHTLNGSYIASVLADDWEFFYECKTNLEKLRKSLAKYSNENLVDKETASIVSGRINELEGLLDQQPKTKSWQKRSKAGTGKKWWRDVEEVSR